MNNRVIKFRARCEKESRYAGEWVKGSLVQCEDGTALIVSAQSDNCQSIYHVDPETMCQFTGVEDYNGNELYEHDLVTTKHNKEPREILWSEELLAFVVKYDNQIVIALSDIISDSITMVGNTLTMNLQYDLDSNFCISNFIPDDNIQTIEESNRYHEYINGAFTTIKSNVGNSPRGEWYKYALLFSIKIVAIGEEQGNYAGGELISIDSSSKDEINAYIKNMASGDEYDKDLYSKICDFEIADKEEMQAFKKSAMDYAHELRE